MRPTPRTAAPLLAQALLALLLSLSASPLRAQEAGSGLTVTGQVRDAATGEPLGGAVVELPDHRLRATTGADGRFVLRGIPSGEQRWVIRRLGYARWEESTAVVDGDELVIVLLASPVALEAITVQADRLEHRREASGVSVEVIDRETILSSAVRNATELVRYRAVRFPTVCAPMGGSGAPASSVGELCTMTRDARPQRVVVCIDEVETSTDALSGYVPHDLYAIEAYDGGRVVRVYTTWFMEQKRPLKALHWGCGKG